MKTFPDSEALRQLPIGVFDSGVGGLTVLRALREQLPDERFIYLGDTARLPYGTKSPHAVLRYSLQAASFLVARRIKYLVVACNTASAVAVNALREQFAPLPVIGVVEPGAAAGCAASRTGHIAVIATEGTVQGGAYQRAIAQRRPRAVVVARACSLFVALAEEGWVEGEIAERVAHAYLDEPFAVDPDLDALLLGCTHFPMFAKTLQGIVGPTVAVVDSALTTAAAVRADLAARDLAAQVGAARQRAPQLLATDGIERFARVGARFLGLPFQAGDVELVDLLEMAPAPVPAIA